MFSAERDANIDFHPGHGLPGDRTGVVVLYLAVMHASDSVRQR
ncbi:hypothetical protein ACF1HJ_31480 [Streptomyces sp. NPDC013978]